jgi:hypothetical protein
LKQNFSKQVFGYFLAAKSDKEKKITEKMEVVERDSLDGNPMDFLWSISFFCYDLEAVS